MAIEIDHVVDYVDDVNAVWGNKLADGIAMRTPFPFRLTLESGVPVSVTDQTAKTVLRTAWTGDNGNRIHLLDGSTFKPYTIDTLPTASLTALAPSTIYDVFGYPLAGVPTLELVAWASTTARASALTDEQGYKVKTSDGKRYLGSILSDAAGGGATDSTIRRGVYNAYNQIGRQILTYNSTASWTYSTAAWAEYNSGTGQVRGEFVIGLPGKSIAAVNFARSSSGSGSNYYLGAALNATNTANVIDMFYLNQAELSSRLSAYMFGTTLPIGYNYLTQVHYTISGTTTVAGTVSTGCRIMMEM